MRLLAAAVTTLSLLVAFPAAAAKAPRKAKAAPTKAELPAEVAPAPEPETTYALQGGFAPSVSGWVGGEFGELSGFYLRADGSLPLIPIVPGLDLIAVGQVGFTHLGKDVFGGSVSWNMAKVTAAGRVQLAFTPELRGYADLGLGFWYGRGTSELPSLLGTTTRSDNHGGFQMRVGAGGTYRLQEGLDVGAELGLNPYLGDAKTTDFFIGVGAQYRL